MSRSLFLLLVISIISCTKDFVANPNSLRPWGENLAREEPYQDSYIATFQAKGKTLIYIAARHATSANDLVFRAKVRSLSLERPYSIQLVQIGMTDEQPGLQRIQTGAKGLPLFQRR